MAEHHPSQWLSIRQAHAVIETDPLIAGAKVLSIGDAPQSHVNMDYPSEIAYEYLARIANHVKVLYPTAEPLRLLHLGAGALTLARWAGQQYLGSTQVAVDLERELVDFVLRELPLPTGTHLNTITADARSVLTSELANETYDVIVLDIFSGPDAPEHLTTPDYYGLLSSRLSPEGVLFVNIGDDPPLRFTDSQVAAALENFNFVALSAPTEMFSRRYPGNLVLSATNRSVNSSTIAEWKAAGPHPSEVLSGTDLDRFGKP